jgi:hypothetical protein
VVIKPTLNQINLVSGVAWRQLAGIRATSRADFIFRFPDASAMSRDEMLDVLAERLTETTRNRRVIAKLIESSVAGV